MPTLQSFKWCFVALLFAVPACDQAPDDDPRPAPPAQTISPRKDRVKSAATTSTSQSARETNYELQGVAGRPRLFQSQKKCEAARSALVNLQAKEARELSKNGALPLSPPVLVCFLV